MILTNQNGDIVPMFNGLAVPTINVTYSIHNEYDLGSFRRKMWSGVFDSPEGFNGVYKPNEIFLESELRLARLRSEIVMTKRPDVTVTLLFQDVNDYYKLHTEVCLYSDFKEFISKFIKQMEEYGTEYELLVAYSTETKQIFAEKDHFYDVKPSLPTHYNPNGANKRQQKRELDKAKAEFMNAPVKEPTKFPDNHKWGRNDCDCEKCKEFKA